MKHLHAIIGIIAVGGATIACAEVSAQANEGSSAASRNTLSEVAPGAKWKSTLNVNLDGDGLMDTVVLGATEEEAILVVILGANPHAPAVFRLPSNTHSQDSICTAPASVHVTAYRCRVGGEIPCRPRTKGAARAHDIEAVRLHAGECDAFHFYFDGKGVRWWRR